MAEDKLGRFMKDKVYRHQSTTDAEALWQKIAVAQNEKPTRRKGMLFWMWGATMVLLLGGLLATKSYWFAEQQIDLATSTILPTVKTTEAKIEGNRIAADQLEISTATRKKKIATPIASNPAEITQATTMVRTELQAKNTTNIVKPVVVAKKHSDVILNTTSVTESESQGLTAVSPVKTTAANRQSFNNKLNREILSLLPALTLPTLASEEVYAIKPGVWAAADRTNARNAFEYSVGLNLIYGSSLKTLATKSDETQGLLDLRRNSETRLEVLAARLDFKMEHHSGLYGKIGLEYEQINERFDFDFIETRTYLDDNQLLEIIYDVNGVPMEVYGTGEVTEILEYKKKVYNSYRMIDIPLLVGYTFKGGDFSLFLESGVAMNINFAPEGELFNASGEPVKLAEEKENIFKTNVGISVLAGIGLSYQLSEQFSLSFSPRIKVRPNSITTDAYPLTQKYTNTAIQLGMRYQWSN
ncbi:MAG: hypothetical protein AB8G15_16765 [Saprospiraceae bacterium]